MKGNILKQRKSVRVFIVGMLLIAVGGSVGLILALLQMARHYNG